MLAQRRKMVAEMAERKLINTQDSSTFEKAFGKAARLPTEEDRKASIELSAAEMRKELFKPKYEPPSFGSPRSAGRNGWQNEIPISAPPGISLIDRIVENSTVVGGVSRSEARR